MDSVTAALRAVGYPGVEEPQDTLLYPGPKRFALIEFALSSLAGGAADTHLQLKDAQQENEEIVSLRLAELLNIFGFPVTVEEVMGCGPAQQRIEFILNLLSMVDRSARLSTRWREDAARSQGVLAVSADSMRTVLAEEAAIFPADFLSAITSGSSGAVALQELHEDAAQAAQDTAGLRSRFLEVDEGGNQGGTAAQESAPAADQQVHLQRFQAATKAFVDLHAEELSTWSNYLPPSTTLGIGPCAKDALKKYRALSQAVTDARGLLELVASVEQDLSPKLNTDITGVVRHCKSEAAQQAKAADIMVQACQSSGDP